jgi:2-polyprenyl-3-methyl-5-hydroxy-6-metoxy-1,4-benzoquinol methylase
MINFYDRYWKERPLEELNDFKYKWPVISKVIPENQKITIFDYGCGSGKIFRELQKMNPKATLIGADISQLAIKRITKQFPKNKFHLISDGQVLPIKSSSVDFITALDVIEHAVHTELLLSEFHRILSPKGKLLISTPYHGLIKNLVICVVDFEIVFNPYGPHIRFFTKKSLLEGTEKSKFKMLKFGYYGRSYPLWRGMYTLLEKK